MKPTKLFLALAVAAAAAFSSSAMAEEVTDSIRTYDLDDVTVHATRLLLVTKNDTTIYDLDALTVKEGALLRDAFERLPGMTFRNGVLYHNGREVKSILINGVDFSRKDPMLALQALPSYINLLNENNGFSRVYDATSLTHTNTNTLGRYAMLSVRYRFATKKK